MGNPLFSALGGANLPAPMGNMMQMMQQFQRFKNSFKGDPKAEVQRLLQSGRISQDQLNQAQQMARQFQQMLPK